MAAKKRAPKNLEQKQAAADANQKYEDAQRELGMVRRWVWGHPDDFDAIRNYALKKAKQRVPA